jgi:hypothetical protein
METQGGLFFLWQNADSVYVPQGLNIQRFTNQRMNIDPFVTYYSKKGGKYSLRSRYYLTNNNNDKNQGSRAELYYGEFQYQKRFMNNFTMTYGAVYMEQQVIADSLYGRHSGYNYAGYAQFDYKYKKLDGKYYIDFVVSEMINNKGSVITYGEIYTFRESELCYSRNSRIDNILN